MKNLIKPLAAVFLAALVAGCIPTWVRVEQPAPIAVATAFSVEVPQGWVRLDGLKDRVLITKDGPSIQVVVAKFASHEKAFDNIEETTAVDMLPDELAKLVIADLKHHESLSALEVVESSPATLDKHMGFRLHLRYKTNKGLAVERVAYGFVDEGGFYQLFYEAPSLHFFARDLRVFERTVESLIVTPRSS